MTTEASTRRFLHSVEGGTQRLLRAARDVSAALVVPWRDPPLRRLDADPALRSLFVAYEAALAAAVFSALALWDDRVAARRARGMEPDAAVDDVYRAFTAGPAACPALVAVVRRHWLAVHRANGALPEAQRVPPQVFLLAWPAEDGRTSWVEVLTAMPYWPIGLDPSGEWV